MNKSLFSINAIVEARGCNRVLSKGKLLAAALPVCLAFTSHQAWAVDKAGGVGTVFGTGIAIDSPTLFATLASVVVGPSAGRHCVAVGSADGLNPFNGESNQYHFGLSLDSGSPNNKYLRIMEFSDGASDDIDALEVSTTGFFTLPSGTHTIHLKARKNSNGSATMRVVDASLSVICLDSKLP